MRRGLPFAFLYLWIGQAQGACAAEPVVPTTHAAAAPAITIYRNASRYDSFPDVQRLPDGRLLCVFRDASGQQPIKHIEPDARIVGALSSDNGLHWSEPVTLYDDAACQNDPSVCVLHDGRLLLTFFNWVGLSAEQGADRTAHPFALKVERGSWGAYAEDAGVYLLEGTAGPLKWDQQSRHLIGDGLELNAVSSSILETKSRTLLLPIYGHSARRKTDEARVLRSTDGGRTWTPPTGMAADPSDRIEMQEPALGQAADGTVVAMMRTAGAEDHLYVSRSADDGVTWSKVERTPLIGHPADVDRLPDGGLLVVYGYRHEPFGVRACVSRDNGRTWDRTHEVVITDTGAHGDLGYPSACLTDDGHVLVAYYMNGKGTNDRWIECKRIALATLK